jgi:hypothetical protein
MRTTSAVDTLKLSSVTVAATIWPWFALLAAVPVVLAGAVTVLRGRAWSGQTTRYEPPAAAGEAGGPDPGEAWDALSRGEDPTR